jgi:hypothetical protein
MILGSVSGYSSQGFKDAVKNRQFTLSYVIVSIMSAPAVLNSDTRSSNCCLVALKLVMISHSVGSFGSPQPVVVVLGALLVVVAVAVVIVITVVVGPEGCRAPRPRRRRIDRTRCISITLYLLIQSYLQTPEAAPTPAAPMPGIPMMPVCSRG